MTDAFHVRCAACCAVLRAVLCCAVLCCAACLRAVPSPAPPTLTPITHPPQTQQQQQPNKQKKAIWAIHKEKNVPLRVAAFEKALQEVTRAEIHRGFD